MQNNFPIINYLIYIVDDTHYLLDVSTEHIIIVSELIKEEKIQIARIIALELNDIYITMLEYMSGLNELKISIEEEGYAHALEKCLHLLQEICELELKLIHCLGCIEGFQLKNFHNFILSHITLEERNALEVLTGYTNKIDKIS